LRITSFSVTPVRVPSPFRYGEIDSVTGVVVGLDTDQQGLQGLGHALTLSDRHFRSLVAATEELGDLLIGEDPRQPERIHRKIVPDNAGGIGNVAAAALDIGVWDLAGKIAGQPLFRLLGGHSDRILAYASLRLGRGVEAADLPGIASALAEQGFKAVKTNLGGRPTVAEDITRMRVIREAIGPHVRLLADVNFRWTPSMAIRMGRTLDDVRLFWLEDPVPTHNVQGLGEVRRAITAQIAAGEALYSVPAFRELFEARVLDVPMPDLLRVGGITPFVKIAHLAEAFGLPLANHLLPEISAQVVAAVPNGLIVEYVPWAWQLFQGCPTLENGELVMSERPGHGMEVDLDFVKHHRELA
jgi:L-alanine-DL-glutamate epimerase-like enolase superfamily enzyme